MVIEVVKSGDTLWRFAQRYGVSIEQIAAVNGILNPNYLTLGQALIIPVQQGQPRPKPVIESNAYLVPTNTNNDRLKIRNTAGTLTYFSLFSYKVQADGNLQPLADQTALATIYDSNAVPMMVVTNFGGGVFSADIARAIFTDAATRRRLIDNILQTMRLKGYFSLNIDFEHLYPADRESYNAFLREITPRLHAAGHMVSTALAPKVSATQSGEWYEAHDYAAHGQIVDFVVLMTYEWGWSGGPPMAVSPIPQVRQVLNYAVSVIPPSKILLGAPLYGYDWTLPYVSGGPFAHTLGGEDAILLALRYGATIQYDSKAQAPFFHYYELSGKLHEVWFEDPRSIQAKLDLVREYKLRGISYWAIGKPFPQNWVLLADNFTIKSYR